MLRADVLICLEINGPLLTRSSAPGEYGIDAVLARNSEGIPYIAGTLVTGKIREALEQISDCVNGSNWFDPQSLSWLGTPNQDGPPRGKRFFLSDFLLRTPQRQGQGVRTRIRLDPERGAAVQGAHLLVDSPFAIGEKVIFGGTMTLFCQDETMLDKMLIHVEAALKWTMQVGGYRSIGYGRISDVRMEKLKKRPIPQPRPTPSETGRLDILIRPEQPFCIAQKPRTDNNLFESGAVIPGSAIIGAMASTWKQLADCPQGHPVDRIKDGAREALKTCFDRIRLTHAFPMAQCLRRPVVAPFSLVKVDGPTCRAYYDVALLPGPSLIHGRIPSFSIDWKNHADVMEDFGWPNLRRELRVRTAIDRLTMRSREAELFAYEMIVPGKTAWAATVDLERGEINHTGKVVSQLTSLLYHGLSGLGKTGTPASIQILEPGGIKSVFRSDPAPRDGLWVLTLQTPALLLDPEAIKTGPARQQTIAGYRQAWSALSKNSLWMIRHFARESLAGGRYLYNRFQRKVEPGGATRAYYPWLLTEAGSVFVLRAKDGREEDAREHIRRWLANGLDLPEWAIKRYGRKNTNGEYLPGDHWTTCPFIPENGFGEVAVNLEIHWTHFPRHIELIDWSGEEEAS